MSAELNHICTTCEHIHNEEKEGVWEELSDNFICPVCGTFKEDYKIDLWHSV